jgi:hypothetical protein
MVINEPFAKPFVNSERYFFPLKTAIRGMELPTELARPQVKNEEALRTVLQHVAGCLPPE